MENKNVIDSFEGEYWFLSNYYYAPVELDGDIYRTNEHLFQSMKTDDRKDKLEIIKQTAPGDAKRIGRHVKLRKDWEDVKDYCMYRCLVLKFTTHKDLAEKLIATGDAILIEGNDWKDKYWGVCKGEGKNRLGELLMTVREKLRNGELQ